jgi:class 3 adenylate cyclase
VEKIKTIGDCYMAVAGIPEPVGDHADRAVALGRAMLEILKDFPPVNGKSLELRIGINSGQVVAGVIGRHKYIYDLWGDTVNTASRMESHGQAGALMVTDATQQALLRPLEMEDCGIREIKGKGPMRTWLIRR